MDHRWNVQTWSKSWGQRPGTPELGLAQLAQGLETVQLLLDAHLLQLLLLLLLVDLEGALVGCRTADTGAVRQLPRQRKLPLRCTAAQHRRRQRRHPSGALQRLLREAALPSARL